MAAAHAINSIRKISCSCACALLPPLCRTCVALMQVCIIVQGSTSIEFSMGLFDCVQMTLYFVYPAIMVIMAWLVYGEVATWVSAAGCAVSLLGVVFIAQPPLLFGGNVQYDTTHWLGMHLITTMRCDLQL